jgi:hypothetical protein
LPTFLSKHPLTQADHVRRDARSCRQQLPANLIEMRTWAIADGLAEKPAFRP